VAIVLTPVMAWSIRHFAAKLKECQRNVRKQKGLAEAWILEMMTGISQWKLLNAHTKVKSDYETKNRQVIEEEICAGYQELVSVNVNEALTLLGQLCVYCIAAFYIVKDTITVGQFVACASYFNALGKKITDITVNMAGIGRVEELLTWETEEDFPGAEDIEIRKGSIRFQEVSFGYDEEGSKKQETEEKEVEGIDADGRKYVLRKFNLQIEAGEKVAFVGRSGGGKSALFQLLCRLYEPCEGEIYVDDTRLTGYTLSSLRQQGNVWRTEAENRDCQMYLQEAQNTASGRGYFCVG